MIEAISLNTKIWFIILNERYALNFGPRKLPPLFNNKGNFPGLRNLIITITGRLAQMCL